LSEKILVVDDEESLAEMVCRALKQQGYRTVSANDGDAALELIEEELPDLVVLDLMLPKMDGWEVCRRAKAEPALKDIPIMMLTARSSSEDVVQGLDLGADDYLKKPFALEELLARVRALLRRKDGTEQLFIENGDLRVDVREREASLRGNALDLSPTEFDILEVLSRRLGHIVTRDELLKKIWGVAGSDTRTVDVHISRLRKKLDDGKLPRLSAQTLRGRGYKLTWEAEECTEK